MLPFYDINAKLRYIKFCLLLFTVMFVLTGVGLIVIGSTINAIYSEYAYFAQTDYFSPATCLIVIGFAIFGVASVGMYGTLTTNPCLISTFGALLGVICLVQMGAGIACHFMSAELIHIVHEAMNKTIYNYNHDDLAAERMDTIQMNLNCCGMYSALDWKEVFNNSEIPRSCCELDNDEDLCLYLHNRSCYSVLSMIIMDTSRILTTSSGVLALMQLTGMAFAFYMAQCLRQQMRARKERKLLVTEQLLYSDVDGTKPPRELS